MNIEPFTFVLERIGQLLVDEIMFLSTDKKKLLDSLQLQVELAQSFARDVEEEKEKSTISHVLDTEFQHIMKILPRIEDYLDTVHVEEVQKSHSKPTFFQNFKACFSCTSNPLVRRHDTLDTGIQLIKDLEDTRHRAVPYQRQSAFPPVKRRLLPPTQPHIMNDEFIVGLEEDIKPLVAKLTGEDGEHTTILGIVGMGGSGKTTLARKLYNHQRIKAKFTASAWVCVSQEWDTTQLLHKICRQVGIQLPQDRIFVPDVEVQEFLLNNSCVVVIDDVWKREALQELLPLLLPGGGSRGKGRVLITTRNEGVLNYPVLGGVYIHSARRLTPEESWELFSKIVRNKWQGIRSFDDDTTFAKLGKEMVVRCYGLPLAIVALAGLLSTKSTIQDWEILRENVGSAIMRQNQGFLGYGPVKYMLELSYSDLPYDLKQCFLYLGIFPEDSGIDVENLIQLWIGEGLLRPDKYYEGQTLEELGAHLVDELVHRCMVQAVLKDYEGKNVAKIWIHDLLRDLCIEKAKESGFFEIASPSTMPSNTLDSMSRRAIIPAGRHSYPISDSRLRSVIKFSKYGVQSTKLEMMYENMRLLRVLDIENVDLRNSEVQIGNLTLLRYLSISRCDGAMNLVLESVKKLRNLLTFKFKKKRVGRPVTVPNDMVGSMEHLRCLTLDVASTTQFGVGRLKSLQSLDSPSDEWLFKDLQSIDLIQTLRRLILHSIGSQTQLDAISDFVGTPANHLQVLHLECSWLKFDLKRMKLECCSQLKSLNLEGRITKQDGPFFFPPNLLDLNLWSTQIEEGEELERALARLHQLRHLSLCDNAYDGDKLTMAGLQQLQELNLIELHNLKEWRIEQGALCQLKHLQLSACSKLERIPAGISGIHTLRDFKVYSMPSSFCERLGRPLEKEDSSRGSEGGSGGQDFHLIAHIPNFRIAYVR